MPQDKNSDKKIDVNQFEYINLYQIFMYFWKNKLIFIVFFIISIIISSYSLRNSSFVYEVKLDIIPLNQNSGLEATSMLNISKLLGVNSKKVEPNLGLYRSLIKSNSIAEILARDKEFLKLVSGSLWDEKTNSIKSPTLSNVSKLKNIIKRILGIPIFDSKISNARFIQQVLSSLEFRPSSAGMTEIIFKTDKTDMGSLILTKAHEATESFLKKRKIKKTLLNIKFIDEKLSQPQKADHRAALIKILSDLEKDLMISSSDMPYAVEAFNDKPVVSDYPVSPNAKLTLIYNGTISIILSIVFIAILVFFNFRKKSSSQ